MDVALILLASGQSRRFGPDNKLLADLGGQPLAAYSAKLQSSLRKERRFAIVSSEDNAVADIYIANNWTVLRNEHSQSGQAGSLKIGVAAAVKRGVDAVIISLADMPFVTDQQLGVIRSSLGEVDSAMSVHHDVLLPPAGFTSRKFPDLLGLTGDRGAKSVFLSSARKTTAHVSAKQAFDIDTPEDLTAFPMEVC